MKEAALIFTSARESAAFFCGGLFSIKYLVSLENLGAQTRSHHLMLERCAAPACQVFNRAGTGCTRAPHLYTACSCYQSNTPLGEHTPRTRERTGIQTSRFQAGPDLFRGTNKPTELRLKWKQRSYLRKMTQMRKSEWRERMCVCVLVCVCVSVTSQSARPVSSGITNILLR